MLRNNFLLILLLLLGFSYSHSQPYGNEWIDFDQDYFKIKIVEDGFYRITAAELEAEGFPIDAVAAERIRLFRNGVEIARDIESNGGRLVHLDFYGERNRGEKDTQLYITPEAQPHPYYNLFTDTATYFLTYQITGQNGIPIQFSQDNNNTGLIPETYFLDEELILQTSDYFHGLLFGQGGEFSLSDYDFGEGWTGSFFGRNVPQDFTFVLDDYAGDGRNPRLEIVFIGGNSLQHLVEVEVGPDENNLRTLSQVSFSNRFSETFEANLNFTDIFPDGSLLVRATALGVNGQAERVSIAAVKVTYPRTFDFPVGENRDLLLENNPVDRSFIRINSDDASSLSIYDISNSSSPIRLASSASGSTLNVVVNGTNDGSNLISVLNPLSVPELSSFRFSEITVDNSDYLIISHPDLRSPTDGSDPVLDYANYRESVTGGSHTVTLANIQQVYDQFNFGDPSPIAIKNFLQFAYDNSASRYLFLIGRGLTVDFDVFRNPPENDSTLPSSYIPPFGLPGSDLIYARGLDPTRPNDPVVSVGRITALTPSDVRAYLNKIIEIEATPFDNLWRKNVVQLSGGQTPQELVRFSNILDNFQNVVESDFMGARAINFTKRTTAEVEFLDIRSEINRGMSLLTFFGHSGPNITDIEVDEPSNLDNQGRYPVFLVNGCNAGEIYGRAISFGEPWILTPNRGAIAFIAHANFALSSTLERYSRRFYEFSFTDESTFGSSVGDIILATSQNYFAEEGTGNTSQTQVYQMLLHGDPGVELFSPENPDYQINDNDVFATADESDRILASDASFNINLVVSNFGRTTSDSLDVFIQQTTPQGSILEFTETFPRVLYQDSLQISIPIDPTTQISGINQFFISIDPNNVVTELNEGNNQASLELFISDGNTIPLFPVLNGVATQNEINLIWQPSIIDNVERSYQLQIDTINTFNSLFFQNVTESGRVLLTSTIDVSNLPDSTNIFWRTRFQDPQEGTDTLWAESNFTIIRNDLAAGAGHFRTSQLTEGQFDGISVNQATGQWDFITTSNLIEVFTFGPESALGVDSIPDADQIQLFVNNIDLISSTSLRDSLCRGNTLNAVFFDRETANPYRPIEFNIGDFRNNLVCGNFPQLIHNLTLNELNGTFFNDLVNALDDGDQVLLFSIDSVPYSSIGATTRARMAELGISLTTFDNLEDGQPAIFFGQKGFSEGQAVEILDNGSGLPPKERELSFSDVAIGTFDSGTFTTNRIGPANRWRSLVFDILDEESNDDVNLEVIGITGNQEVVLQNVQGRSVTTDLATIDASVYPNIRLRYSFSDPTNLTTPRIGYWHAQYDTPPEGILIPSNFNNQIVQEGDSIRRDFIFYNFSNTDFQDSIDFDFQFLNLSGAGPVINNSALRGPTAGDSTVNQLILSTRSRVGQNNLIARVTPRETEQYANNNVLVLSNFATIEEDEINPILDVTFDGTYILDGDLVSPTPAIRILLKDNNDFLAKSDTSGISVFLRNGEEGNFTRIPFSSPSITWTPATAEEDFVIEYTPGPLVNDVYGLRVEATDESGNRVSEEPYEITFEVVNESTITHFYPYPNPFSTSTRFVFTLTGSEIPDEIKIQIMTVTGRVVREILQDEIGPIRVGNNITEFAWDGTDQFGDQLANGVYLYRVLTRANGQSLQNRATSADRAFKNGFGKLYILR